MMAGNPSWWSMHLHPPSQHPSTLLTTPSPSLFPQYVVEYSATSLPDNQELPQSCSQLLSGGFSGEEERLCPSNFQPKKLENWENQILNPSLRVPVVEVIKQEVTQQHSNLYGHHHASEEFQAPRLPVPPAAWSQIMGTAVLSPSPRSCITTSSSNMLDFTYNKATDGSISNTQPPVDHSSECNSKGSGGVFKKARVQTSSSQPPLKVNTRIFLSFSLLILGACAFVFVCLECYLYIYVVLDCPFSSMSYSFKILPATIL
uniref:Uncharacterized protein n=1 Tax=Gossypium raimondii TaxID=29730 RepID=A0A0D2UQG1_GOSRA|nr:hypothetical protein B456_011G073400 [Gossypium raimondii]